MPDEPRYRIIDRLTGQPEGPYTVDELDTARKLGIRVEGDSKGVLAARILDEVAEAIGDYPPRPCTERQQSFAESLGCAVSGDSLRVASVKIEEKLFEKDEEAMASTVPGVKISKLSFNIFY